MAGIFLNSYGVKPEGLVALYQMAGELSARSVRDLRQAIGIAVWKDGDDAYSYLKPSGLSPARVEREMTGASGLMLFVVREALVQHALAVGLDASARRTQELEIRGFAEPVSEDLFEIEQVLVLRVTSESYVTSPFILTARPRSRWRCAASLSDQEVAKHAIGESAVRLAGDGPLQGRIENISGDVTTLLRNGEPIQVSSDDYRLAVNAALVSRWRGPSVLESLRVTAGDLTVRHRRNQHAIADRFKFMGTAIRRLGEAVPVSGGGALSIGAPVQVRLERRA